MNFRPATLRQIRWRSLLLPPSRAPYFIALLFFFLQAWNLYFAAKPEADEGVYAEAGRMMFSGQIPYQSFPFSHMPLLPLLIGFGLKVFGSMYFLRLLYLACNCFIVIPLHRILRTLGGSDWVALPPIIAYLTFHEMMHHDFRFLAIRQLANALLIVYLYCAIVAPHKRWSLPMQYACSILSGFLFLPALLNIIILSVALPLLENLRSQRLAAARRYLGITVVSFAAITVYLFLLPEAFRQVVVEQMQRGGSRGIYRLKEIFDADYDIFLLYTSFFALLASLFVFRRHRPLMSAMLLMLLLAGFLSKNYFPHYLSIAGPAVAFGMLAFVLLLLHIGEAVGARRSMAITGTMLFFAIHLSIVLPSLFDEWSQNMHRDYRPFIAILSKLPEPLLTAQPIYAVEAARAIVPDLMRTYLRPPADDPRYTARDFTAMAEHSCTILLDDWTKGVIPDSIQAQWKKKFTTFADLPRGLILLTGLPQCESGAALK